MTHPLRLEETVAAWIEHPVAGSQQVWELAKRLTAHRKRHWPAGQGQVADCVEHGNEPLGFTNTRDTLDILLRRGMPFSILYSDFCPRLPSFLRDSTTLSVTQNSMSSDVTMIRK